MKRTALGMITTVVAAVLVAKLCFPMLKIYGTSMNPTLQEGEIVVSVKSNHLERGDIVAFYYGDKVLIKRCIAGPGSYVDIQRDGTVAVNGETLEEAYLTEKSFGICNLELPYHVPEDMYFMMGDHRENSLDSRNSSIGCVSKDQVIGKILFRVWPLGVIDTLK